MFIDEIKAKFPDDLVADFSFTVFGDSFLVGAGIKSLAYLSENEIRFRVNKRYLLISGTELTLAEIGQGEFAVKGKIASVEIV
ncbi:MAG TPA: YabP/YqfC family sporulation protein [Clostridia bacterium]|nr:YabP/YqfC family sporulation protein [Clostridia bacterium]